MTSRILVVDDDAGMRAFLRSVLEPEDFEVEEASNTDDALARALGPETFDAIITDIHMGERSGLDLCRELKTARCPIPILVLTGFGSMEIAVEALRAGAVDFLQKPLDVDLLVLSVAQAVEKAGLRRENIRLRAQAEAAYVVDVPGMIGSSAQMAQVRGLIARLARTPSSVLICGESGTGKEIAARSLHDLGPRSDGPFVAVNCAAFPEALLESELFGHKKGAFTDARTDHAGMFLEADGGTLFLDEVGDMPIGLQPKLLRVLQERCLRPLGGTKDVAFDVRVITATHQDLEAKIDAGTFREDLYFRLNVVQLDLPPLRARENDVIELARHLLASHAAALHVPVASFAPAAAQALLDYDWPGNVRELSNCVERAVALCEGGELQLADLPARVQRRKKPGVDTQPAPERPELLRLDEVERQHILRVLELCGGSRGQSAKLLGIDRKTLYRKLESWGTGERRGDDE